ncbi:MAG: hypothetical protein ACP5OG_00215 [Candidatus Nanoarchaeia archaeon]
MSHKINNLKIHKIIYEARKEKVHSKVNEGKLLTKYVPTEKSYKQMLSKIKKILKNKGINYHKSYFRIFNSSRLDNLLKYGSDRAEQLEKRKFDKTEWELYPFRLYMDYFYTNDKGELLLYENGPLLKDSNVKTIHEFRANGKLRDVYDIKVPDKKVLNYYNKITKKYKYLEKEKNSKYYELYQKLKKVKTEFPKGEKAWQPEFMLSEKLAMKKHKLMRDDVTYAYLPSQGMGMEYILLHAIKKRVSDKVSALAVYNNLIPILPRKCKGGFDETALYTFKGNRLNSLVTVFLLIPKEK